MRSANRGECRIPTLSPSVIAGSPMAIRSFHEVAISSQARLSRSPAAFSAMRQHTSRFARRSSDMAPTTKICIILNSKTTELQKRRCPQLLCALSITRRAGIRIRHSTANLCDGRPSATYNQAKVISGARQLRRIYRRYLSTTRGRRLRNSAKCLRIPVATSSAVSRLAGRLG
jgi:hypothetical protein